MGKPGHVVLEIWLGLAEFECVQEASRDAHMLAHECVLLEHANALTAESPDSCPPHPAT